MSIEQYSKPWLYILLCVITHYIVSDTRTNGSSSPQWIEKACHMFGLNPVDIQKALIKPRIKVGSEYVHKGQNADQVKNSIKALCKSIFEKLFKLVLDMCNETLETKNRRSFFIGVLDIAGFEIFDVSVTLQMLSSVRCINILTEGNFISLVI